MITGFRRFWIFCSILLVMVAPTRLCEAADKTAATLHIKDALAVPAQPTTIEAKLSANSILGNAGLGGEPLELVIDGKVAATAMTGGDGRAVFTHSTKTQGVMPIQVRVGNSPRVVPTAGEANLVVWERRSPILVIEMASLMNESPPQSLFPGIGIQRAPERNPMPDAAVEIGKLTQFYYKAIYVVSPAGSDGFRDGTEARAWLKTHRFPPGYVLVLPPGNEALGTKIDELRASGWNAIKAGIGRTKTFAEVCLQRRLEAVIIPEPPKGDIPRKAKVAKEWKEIRKKL
jgi:hypothetical protein